MLSFEYCLTNQLLGVGWQIQLEPNERIDWNTYEKRAIDKYEKIPIVSYIKKSVDRDDLVWTRDLHGQYYLGRVISP